MYEFDSLHEPLPGGVDVDRARPLAGLVERRLAEAARCAATAATTPRPSASVCGAEPHRGGDRLAGVAGVGDRPLALVGLVAAVLAGASRGLWAKPPAEISTPCRARTVHRRAVAHRAHARRRGRPRRSGRRAAPRSTPGCPGRRATREQLADERRAVRQQRLPPDLGADGAERHPGRDGEGCGRCGCSSTATGPRWSSPPGRGSGPARAAASAATARAPRRPTAPARCRGRRRGRPWQVRVVVAVAGAGDEAHARAAGGTSIISGPAVRNAWRRSNDEHGPTSPTTVSKWAMASS